MASRLNAGDLSLVLWRLLRNILGRGLRTFSVSMGGKFVYDYGEVLPVSIALVPDPFSERIL